MNNNIWPIAHVLRTPHVSQKRLSHPVEEKFLNLWKLGWPWDEFNCTKKLLAKVKKRCITSQQFAQPPIRFKSLFLPIETLYSAMGSSWTTCASKAKRVYCAHCSHCQSFLRCHHFWSLRYQLRRNLLRVHDYLSLWLGVQCIFSISVSWKQITSLNNIELHLSGITTQRFLGIAELYHEHSRWIHLKMQWTHLMVALFKVFSSSVPKRNVRDYGWIGLENLEAFI